MAEEQLDLLKVEVKRALKIPVNSKVAVHLTLVSKGLDLQTQRTSPQKGPTPQWQQQFTFNVVGMTNPKLRVSLLNVQSGKSMGQESIEIIGLPFNRPLSNDIVLNGMKVFLVLLAIPRPRSPPAMLRASSPTSSDSSVGAKSGGFAALAPTLPQAAISQQLVPYDADPALEVKVTSAKGFESLPACQMCVEVRLGTWKGCTPSLPNQNIAIWNHVMHVPLPHSHWPLALSVVDSDTDLVLGSGVLDIATLQWSTASAHMQSVLMLAGRVQVGTVSLLLRSANPSAITAWAQQVTNPSPKSMPGIPTHDTGISHLPQKPPVQLPAKPQHVQSPRISKAALQAPPKQSANHTMENPLSMGPIPPTTSHGKPLAAHKAPPIPVVPTRDALAGPITNHTILPGNFEPHVDKKAPMPLMAVKPSHAALKSAPPVDSSKNDPSPQTVSQLSSVPSHLTSNTSTALRLPVQPDKVSPPLSSTAMHYSTQKTQQQVNAKASLVPQAATPEAPMALQLAVVPKDPEPAIAQKEQKVKPHLSPRAAACIEKAVTEYQPLNGIVELLIRKNEDPSAGDAVVRLHLRSQHWTQQTPAMKFISSDHKVSIPVPMPRPPDLKMGIYVFAKVDSPEPMGLGSLNLSEVPVLPTLYRIALGHPSTGRQVGSLEVRGRFYGPVPTRREPQISASPATPARPSAAKLLIASQEPSPARAPPPAQVMALTASPAAPSNATPVAPIALSTDGVVVDGTFHVRSLEFKLTGDDSSFWERPAFLSAQVTLRSCATTVGQRTKPAPKGITVNWSDSFRFTLSDTSSSTELQLWELLETGQQLMGQCTFALPEKDEEQRVRVLLRPTPLYSKLTITVLALYSVKYGQKLQAMAVPVDDGASFTNWLVNEYRPPDTGAIPVLVPEVPKAPETLKKPTIRKEPHIPKADPIKKPDILPTEGTTEPKPQQPHWEMPQPPPKVSRVHVPMPTVKADTGIEPPALPHAMPPRAPAHILQPVPPAHKENLEPVLPQRGLDKPRNEGTLALHKPLSLEQSMAVAAPSSHCPSYVNMARSKDSLQLLSGAIAPISFLISMAAKSPSISALMYFTILFFCYMNWIIQLILVVALGTVAGSNFVRAALTQMSSHDVRKVRKAAVSAEERLISLSSTVANLCHFFIFRRPSACLGLLGGLLVLSAAVPSYGLSLICGTAVLSLFLPLPAEDTENDLYVHAKPLTVLTPWFVITSWFDDGLMLLGATIYLVSFVHVPILRDYPKSASIHAFVCFCKAAATGVRRPFVGSLHVQVVGAKLNCKELVNTFVMLTGEKGQLRYTKVATGISPKWGELWEPLLVSNLTSCKLQVWEASNSGVGMGHGLVGEASLNIRGPTEEAEKFIPLTNSKGPAGHLHLRFQVLPVQSGLEAAKLESNCDKH